MRVSLAYPPICISVLIRGHFVRRVSGWRRRGNGLNTWQDTLHTKERVFDANLGFGHITVFRGRRCREQACRRGADFSNELSHRHFIGPRLAPRRSTDYIRNFH